MTEEAKPVHTPTPDETHGWDKGEASICTESLRAKGYSVRLELPGRKYFSSTTGYGVTIMLTPAKAKELAGDKQFIDVTQDGYRFRWMRTGDSVHVWRSDAPVTDEPLETFLSRPG